MAATRVRRRAGWVSVGLGVAAGLLAWPARSEAQQIVLQDGAAVLTLPAGQFSSLPVANLTGTEGTAAADPVYASGWWYRLPGDTSEHALGAPSAIVDEGVAGKVTIYWNFVGGSSISLIERIWVEDLGGPSGGFVSEISATNAGATQALALFHYLDPEAGGTSGNDTVALVAPLTTGYLKFTDGANVVRYRAQSTGGIPPFRVGSSSDSVLTRLNDGAPTTLNNSTLATTGDLNAGFQFDVHANSGDADTLKASVSVTSRALGDRLKGDNQRGLFPSIQFRDGAGRRLTWRMLRNAQVKVDAQTGPHARAVVGTDDFRGSTLDQNLERDTSSGVYSVEGSALSPQPAAGWSVAATGDLNADGRADILWRNAATQKLSVWTMNDNTRQGVLTPSPDQAVDANWEVVGLADFNNDGTRDFLWYNQTSRKLVIWYMNAALQRITGVFTNPTTVGSLAWRVVAVGDFGKGGGAGAVWNTPDIVWQNDSSGKIVVWHMDAAATRTSGVFTSPDTLGAGTVILGPR